MNKPEPVWWLGFWRPWQVVTVVAPGRNNEL